MRDLDNLEEAELSTHKAIKLNPDSAEAYTNLANVLVDLNNLKGAELSTRKAIEIKPDFALAHSNLGIILQNLGKLKGAELSTRKAIELKPDSAEAVFTLSSLQMLQDDYISGLKNYESRFEIKRSKAELHAQPKIPRWLGELSKKGERLLIISEQGLGDTIHFMRYVPCLREKGYEVKFCAQTKLHSLIKASGIDNHPLTPEQTITISEGNWIPLLSIPRYLKVTPNNPIRSEPYIHSTDELNKKWKQILSKEKRPIVGINWQGNPKAEKSFNKGRSLALEIFSTLARNNNFKFLSLQKGFGSEQLDHCSFRNKFVECQAQIDSTWDFLENAAIIENCDLIITSDTSIAHVAGGMGKKVWLLLKYIPEWRWGLEKESTFWYPSMRLFRQKERHNWQEVMERLSSEITKELGVKV